MLGKGVSSIHNSNTNVVSNALRFLIALPVGLPDGRCLASWNGRARQRRKPSLASAIPGLIYFHQRAHSPPSH